MSLFLPKPARTRYTATVALVLMGLIGSPAFLLASNTLELIPVSVALGFSALCGALAWHHWNWHAETLVPSIIKRPLEVK